MKVAYIAGPYRADTESQIVKNIQNAEKVAIELWRRGYAVICPHKNTAFFGGLCEDSVWLEGDLEIMKRCDFVVVVDGWKDSSGTIAEINEANLCGIPVYFENMLSHLFFSP